MKDLTRHRQLLTDAPLTGTGIGPARSTIRLDIYSLARLAASSTVYLPVRILDFSGSGRLGGSELLKVVQKSRPALCTPRRKLP